MEKCSKSINAFTFLSKKKKKQNTEDKKNPCPANDTT